MLSFAFLGVKFDGGHPLIRGLRLMIWMYWTFVRRYAYRLITYDTVQVVPYWHDYNSCPFFIDVQSVAVYR